MPKAPTRKQLQRNRELAVSQRMVRSAGDYVFFWKPNGDNGRASQWYQEKFTEETPLTLIKPATNSSTKSDASSPSPSTENPNAPSPSSPTSPATPTSTTLPAGPVTFRTAEHYMMYYKAVLFNDFTIAERILEIENPSAVRTLGRQVKNFDDAVWKKNREHVVYHANLLKFGTNPELKKWLLETEDKELVEASPSDKIWGIGKTAAKALESKDKWGMNLLGKAIMRVREELKRQESNSQQTTNPPV